MIFHKLIITNFKSFLGEHAFDFAAGEIGLHFITGRNEVEPGLGANGAGKSTIFDALSWVLYGKTLRGLKAGDVAAWDVGKTVEVKLDLETDAGHFFLSRSWKPNSLILADKNKDVRSVEQIDVDALIGLSFEAFQHAIVIGQFSEMFFDLGPAQKLALFSDVLTLDSWIVRSEQAAKAEKAVRREMEEAVSKIAGMAGKKEAFTEQLVKVREQEETFGREIKDRRSAAQKRIKDIEGQRDKLEALLGKHMKSLTQVEKTLHQTQNDLTEASEAANDLRSAVQEIALQTHPLEERKRILGKQLEMVSGLASKCPVCGQKVTGEHKKVEIERLREEIDETEKSIRALAKEQHALDKEILGARELALSLAEQAKVSEQERTHLSREVQGIKEDLIGTERDLKAQRERLKETDAVVNIYSGQVKQIEAKLKELQKQIADAEKALDELVREAEAFGYWMKGFKEIRLSLIAEALTLLEVEVNNSLLELGLHGWQVTFDVEKETKAGGVMKGFHVFVKAPTSPERVPWEAWSGGEGQRLRLAGTMGLSALILTSLGVSSSIEVWDEPSQHLSETGINDLLDLLAARAQAQGRSVFLVDHRSFDYGGFASRSVVIKDEAGSRIENG